MSPDNEQRPGGGAPFVEPDGMPGDGNQSVDDGAGSVNAQSPGNTLLEAALKYAQLGWYVFPVHSIRNGRCSCARAGCNRQGKHPRTRNGFTDATIGEATIRRWWKRWPDASVGIATGTVSNIWVLDIDPRHGGDISFEQLGDVAAEVEQQTGGSGRHLAFECNGHHVPSRTNLLPGIDVRGEGGYIIAEPSNHESGGTYTWLVEADPTEGATPAPAPEHLLQLVCKEKKPKPVRKALPKYQWTHGLRTIKGALSCIPADDRDVWLRVGMALHYTGGDEGYDVWTEWSRTSEKFDPDDQRKTWESFKDQREDPVTIGTLFYLAGKNGWEAPTGPDLDLPSIREELEALLDAAVEADDPTVLYERAALVALLPPAEELMYVDRASETIRSFKRTDFTRTVAAERRRLKDLEKEKKRAAAQKRAQVRREEAEQAIDELVRTSGRNRIETFDAQGLAKEPLIIHAEAIAALREHSGNDRLFRRGVPLWRVVENEEGRPVLERLGPKEMEAELLKVALFIEQPEDAPPQPCDPPSATIRTLLGSADLPFPQLVGITLVPLLRPDGSILQQPGYDEQTRLLFADVDGLAGIEVPSDPSTSDVRDAVEALDEVIRDFPFADQASRANSYALTLTGFMQPLVQDNRPICTINARLRGSGKSLLADSCARILTGRPHVTTRFRMDEEMEKKIAELLQKGIQFITIDNVKNRVESATLESVLTARRHSDRRLGYNDQGFDVAQDAVWVLTGNNLELGSEMARRSYPIELDPKHPHPEDRVGPAHGGKFKNLAEWIPRNRARLVWACLTLCRSWCSRGRPEADLPPFGSFESWQRSIGGVLLTAGIEGFLENRVRFRAEQDEERRQFEVFLRGVIDRLGAERAAGGFPAARLARELEHSKALQDVVPDSLAKEWRYGGRGLSVQIGQLLRRLDGRRLADDGLRVERAGEDSHSKVVLWRVVTDA